MSRKEILQSWLKEREWDDEIQENDDYTYICTNVQLENGKIIEVYVELAKKSNFVFVYMYLEGALLLEKKWDESYEIFHEMNKTMSMGRIGITDSGRFQYKIGIDPGKEEIETCLIEGMYSAGAFWMEEHSDDLIKLTL